MGLAAVFNTAIYLTFTDGASEKSAAALNKDIQTLSSSLSKNANFYAELFVYAAVGVGAKLAKRHLQKSYNKKYSGHA
ncbi:MAG: hypothetical protein AABX69_00815 [Nanoarchaeota archaeon]